MKKLFSFAVCGAFIAASIVSCKDNAGGGLDAAKSQLAVDSIVNAKLAALKTELDAKCAARVDSAAKVIADSLTKAGVKAPVVAKPAAPAVKPAPTTKPTTTTKPVDTKPSNTNRPGAAGGTTQPTNTNRPGAAGGDNKATQPTNTNRPGATKQ